MKPFPWEEVMRFGFGTLKLSSEHFWAMTPREIAAAMQAHKSTMLEPPRQSDLERMMAQFPDEPNQT